MASGLSVFLCSLLHRLRIDCACFYFLYSAIRLAGRRDVAEYLMNHMDPMWTGSDGSTLLHFACRLVC